MKLTPNQREAVEHPGNTLLVACPGSGKTRTIIAKILRCVPEVRDTARRVACITYTNAAVHEIQNRLHTFGEMGDDEYCDVSTIHAFCLNHILRPFCWRTNDYPEGFEVLSPDQERYGQIVEDIKARHGLDAREKENFQLLSREPDGTPIVSGNLTVGIAHEFWDQLRAERLIDFPNIVFEAYQLLAQHPRIAAGLACKFAWILVDEFQDTSALQVQILTLIAIHNKTKFFLVGDPAQSIYAFAGARPQLMQEFSQVINARTDFQLRENFRCGQPVIDHAEILWPRVPPMLAAGDAGVIDDAPRYSHANNAFQAITEEFLPWLEEEGVLVGNAAILAPWWTKLYPIGKQLREFGVQIIGPGARPYRRNRLIAPLAESICGYLERPSPSLIPQIEKEIFSLVSDLTGHAPFRVFSYEGRRTVYKLIRASAEVRENHEAAVDWLSNVSAHFANILIVDDLVPTQLRGKFAESANDMRADMERNNVDIDNLSVSDLGLFACPSDSLKLLTMHGSKGREFDAVAVIDLHEGRVPDFRRLNTQEGVDEGRRLLYVAATRARRLLLYVTDQENHRNHPSRFLGDRWLNLLG